MEKVGTRGYKCWCISARENHINHNVKLLKTNVVHHLKPFCTLQSL